MKARASNLKKRIKNLRRGRKFWLREWFPRQDRQDCYREGWRDCMAKVLKLVEEEGG